MAADHPLGRCKSYFAAFSAIDAAIEAADPDVSRDEFRRVRSAVVEKICDQQDGEESDGELCQKLLDEAMVESLLTLRIVPVEPATLTKTELLRSVQALKKHGSERVRVLARDVMCGWRASLQHDLEKVREMLSQIDHLSMEMQMETTETEFKNPSQQKKVAAMSVGGRTAAGAVPSTTLDQPVMNKKKTTTDLATVATAQSTKTTTLDQPVMNKKKTTADLVTPAAIQWTKTSTLDQPVVNKKKTRVDLATAAVPTVLSTKTTALDQLVMVNKKTTTSTASGDLCGSLSAKMEVSKRKLREGYQEVENAKKQRKIQIIKAPEIAPYLQRAQQGKVRRELDDGEA